MKIKAILIGVLILLVSAMALAYTPYDKHEIELVLDTDYTPYDNHAIELKLTDIGTQSEPEADPCACTTEYCEISCSECNNLENIDVKTLYLYGQGNIKLNNITLEYNESTPHIYRANKTCEVTGFQNITFR